MGGGGGTKRGEAVLEDLGDPDGIIDVGLAAWALGDLDRIGRDAGDRLLQHVEDGPPVDAGAVGSEEGGAVEPDDLWLDSRPSSS